MKMVRCEKYRHRKCLKDCDHRKAHERWRGCNEPTCNRLGIPVKCSPIKKTKNKKVKKT